jgi:hypothetical protein
MDNKHFSTSPSSSAHPNRTQMLNDGFDILRVMAAASRYSQTVFTSICEHAAESLKQQSRKE